MADLGNRHESGKECGWLEVFVVKTNEVVEDMCPLRLSHKRLLLHSDDLRSQKIMINDAKFNRFLGCAIQGFPKFRLA